MKIYFKKSSIHGLGIFAKVPIRRGETVTIIKGVRHHKVNKTVKDVFMHPDWIGYNEFEWIDPKPPHKYINHSCDPNVGIRGRFLITALRDISKDEEVVIDYSIIEPDSRWFMKCQCGKKECRGTIRSIELLPKKLFNKYTPFIPAQLKKLYARKEKHLIK